MKKFSPDIPTLSIDLVRYRIRLSGSTLDALDNPKYVLMVINPEDMSIGIIGTDKPDAGTHRVVFGHATDKSCEIYSRGFLLQIAKVCNEIKVGSKYRIYGRKITGQNFVKFEVLDYTEITLKDAKK